MTISFDYRVLSEYRIKIAKMEILGRLVINHKKPNGEEAKGASEFLDLLIDETDRFYESNGEILSKNGKRPHRRSRLAENTEWAENVRRYNEEHPRRRPR